MLAFELGDDALDGTLHAERLAAADAFGRLFLLDDPGHGGRGAEIDLRLEADDFLRAGRLAQSALDAGVFGKAEHRALRIVGQCAGRTRRHAGQAQRAAFNVDFDCTKRRASGQRHDIDRRPGLPRCNSRRASRMTSRLRPVAENVRGFGRAVHRWDAAQHLAKRIRVIGLDRCGARAGEAKAGQDRFGQRNRLVQARDIVLRFGANEEAHRRASIGESRLRSPQCRLA